MARNVFVTGSAGFIGFHLSKLLLDEGCQVVGYDGMTTYYDVTLKQKRHALLQASERFSAVEAMLEDRAALRQAVLEFRPDMIVHLAAQAGVRYSLEAPGEYVSANIVGSFNVMEVARDVGVQHLVMASSSSVFGANTKLPYIETDPADHPLTIYAATKKANEVMAHSWAHLYDLPITLFRFFTVYGPWGRPDMALFKFTRGILEGTPIDVYNHGDMWRDFTYVDDLVRGIRLLMDAIPDPAQPALAGDTMSAVSPCRVVNIGNSEKVRLTDFIDAIEKATGRKAHRNLMDMQQGDVPATWADCGLLQRLTGYRPATSLQDGVDAFVDWYRDYYQV